MPVIIAKNGPLNAAATGFAGGFERGVPLGQEQQKIDQEKQSQAFFQDQVLRKAKLADEQNQREADLRGATADYAQAITAPDAQTQGPAPIAKNAPGMFPGAPASGGPAPQTYEQQLGRIGGILGRMAKDGASAQEITTAAGIFKAKQKEKADEDARSAITDQVTRGTAAGSYFTQQPDGTRTSTPAMDKALQQFTEAAANKNTPPEVLRQLKGNLDREQILQKSTFEHVNRTMEDLRGRIAQMQQPTTPGPQSPTQYAAQSAKMQKAQMLASTYEHLAPQLMADPEKMRAFEEQFWPQFSATENNIAYQSPKYGAVTFENADQMRKAETENAQLKQALVRTQMQHVQKQIEAIPQELGIKQQNADSARTAANRARVGENPNPLNYKDAAAIIDSQPGAKDMSPEQRATAIRDEVARANQTMGSLKPGAPSYYGVQGGAAKAAGAPTAQAPTVEKAKAAGWTAQEWADFRESGKVPAGKPIQ